MAPPPILSSPFLTHTVIDTLLSKSPAPQDRIQLLSAKIHLYTNPSLASQTDKPPLHPTSETSNSGPESSSEEVTKGEAGPSTSQTRRGDEERIPEMRTRLDLAVVQLGEMGGDGGSGYAQQAEATLRIVLEWTKGVEKGVQRRRKVARGCGSKSRGDDEEPASAILKPEEADVGWEEELPVMRRRALEMMIQLEESSGRVGRLDGLRKQLADAVAPQQAG